MHDVDVVARPVDQRGDVLQRVAEDGGIEGHAQAPDLGHHLGVLQPQLVELELALALPPRSRLARVDVEGEAVDAGPLERLEQLRGQGQRVGVDDRLEPELVADHPHDVDDVRVDQRIATGDRDRVHPSLAGEDLEVGRAPAASVLSLLGSLRE